MASSGLVAAALAGLPLLGASDPAGSPYLSLGLSGAAGAGLLVLFWRVQRGVIREQGKEYNRVKAERDEAIADHQSCEELVDRLVGALRNAGVVVPWTWKHTPPAPAAPGPKPLRREEDHSEA